MWKGSYLKPSLSTHLCSKAAHKCHKILIQNKSSLWHQQSEDIMVPWDLRGSMFTLTDDHITSRHMVGCLTLLMLPHTPLHVGCWLFQTGSDGSSLKLKLCSSLRNKCSLLENEISWKHFDKHVCVYMYIYTHIHRDNMALSLLDLKPRLSL